MNQNTFSQDTVVILAADAQDTEAICDIIEKGPYRAITCSGLSDLESMLESNPCLVVLLDIDSVPLENRTIRELTLSFPSTCFLCTSKDRFHPDLKDAICYHLFACLHKPIDPDELHYFLNCIRDNESDSRGPPVGSN